MRIGILMARIFLVSFVLLFGSIACPLTSNALGENTPPETTGTPTNPASAGTIVGRVVDDAGAPVLGARVILRRFDAPSQRFGHFVKVGPPTLTDNTGAFKFDNLPDGWFLIDIKSTGFARSFAHRTIEKGLSNSTADISLESPCRATIEVTDEAGNPVAGVRIRQVQIDGNNGSTRMSQMALRDLEIAIPSSDSSGRLTLTDLPEGALVQLILDHPSLAPVKIESLKIRDGIVAKTTMKRGVVVTFHRHSRTPEDSIKTAVLELHHTRFESASTVLRYELEFDQFGNDRLAIEPGDYDFLRLQHDDFYLTPTLTAGNKREPSHPLHFEPGKNVEMTFTVHRRRSARGRVIDAETGEPVADASLLGEILNEVKASGGSDETQLNFTGWADTDAKGEFTLPVAAGRMRVQFNGENRIAESEPIDFDVSEDDLTVIPDIKVRSIPKVSGVVRTPDGKPARDVVVRFRGETIGSRHICAPVLTDDQGRFELQPTFVINDDKTKRPQLDYSILAFHAYEPLAVRTEVRLVNPQPVELTLEPHDYDWPLTQFPEGMTEWERGIVPAERAAENLKVSLRGQPAPDLDCCKWLNSDPLDWNSLRGKYVLLDFWFINCGPCQEDLPVVRMAHELYHDKGLVVIGVHSNVNPPDQVEEHVRQTKLPFPIAVDHPDGRTVSKFQTHKLVLGFPSYVLIDRAGNVLLDDRTIPHPTLRSFKLEIIRNTLFGNSKRQTAP